MGGFFLHSGALVQISNAHPKLFKGETDKHKTKSEGFKFNNFIFKVAESGISGTAKDVNELKIYELFEILEYLTQ